MDWQEYQIKIVELLSKAKKELKSDDFDALINCVAEAIEEHSN